MIISLLLLIAGLVILTIGAESLVRGSASLAIRLGLTPLVIGLTIVAFGTSTPELVVSLSASLNHQPDIALGNVVGSNIFNIGIILGITALICPISVNFNVIKMDGPVMVAISLIITGLHYLGTFSRLTGFCLFSGLVLYTVFTVRMAFKEESNRTDSTLQEGIPPQSRSVLLDVGFITGGLVLLVAGSRLLVVSAVDIARYAGVSEAVIGLTIISAGTSMPELATSLVAALRRQPDIAVGNVVGSNIFNILGILGPTAMISPLTANGISHVDMWVMTGFAVFLVPLLYTDLKLNRWEGGTLLLGYAAYLWWLLPASP